MLHSKSIRCLLGAVAFAAFVLSGCSSDLLKSADEKQYGSITLVDAERSVITSDLGKATVTVCGSGMADIVKSDVEIKSDGTGSTTIEKIPVGKNRVIKVQSELAGAVLYGVKDIIAGNNPVEIGWSTTAKGHIYYELLKTQSFDISSIVEDFSEYIPDVHAALVDCANIAKDYKENHLKDKESYVLSNGSVQINATGMNGFTVQVTDIASKKVKISSDSFNENVTACPGEWKVIVSKGDESKDSSIIVAADETTVVTLDYGAAVTDKIVVKVPVSYGYNNIHYWECGSAGSSTWPGKTMSKEGEYYTYELACTTANLLFVNSSNKKQTADLSISAAGIWVFNGSGFDKVSGNGISINVKNPEVPLPPAYTMPDTASLGETFTISVNSNCELTTGTVTIGSVTKELSAGNNVFNVADFTSSETTLTVNGIIENKAGSKNINGSIKISAKPIVNMPVNWNELTIYQVMVASFQDGDSSIGYTQMWGPDNQLKGGDLQGVINAIPYIKELGCNAIWMTPIFNSNGNSKLDATGYFAYDYFNIDPKFGTMDKFDELVEKCHKNGIAVILDGVFGHNKGSVAASPSRNGIKNPGISPSTSNPVDYAGNANSLKFYSDVARYWITEHKIDGWRFDQCYQVAFGEKATGSDNCKTGGHNYWYDIRKVIEEAAAKNGTKGQDWGTLGYMVGEHWNGDASIIQKGTVTPGNSKGYGLQGCFDFPAYYQLVQGFAQEWDGKATGNIGSALSYTYKTYNQKGYECKEDDGSYETYYPNVMLSNHDLFRVGDLIQKKHGCGFDSDEYAKRNQVLLAAQAAYTGPITIYYGDEIADHNATTTSGWGADNVARSSGKISGFNSREQKVHDWTQKCLKARAEHKALWNGTNSTVKSESDFYVAKKQAAGETIYIAFNYNKSSSKSFSASGTDLISGQSYSGTVTVPALSAVYILAE